MSLSYMKYIEIIDVAGINNLVYLIEETGGILIFEKSFHLYQRYPTY